MMVSFRFMICVSIYEVHGQLKIASKVLYEVDLSSSRRAFWIIYHPTCVLHQHYCNDIAMSNFSFSSCLKSQYFEILRNAINIGLHCQMDLILPTSTNVRMSKAKL